MSHPAYSSPEQTLHATLVLVDGEGVLIVGDAGSGKSSVALRMLQEGHSLVADDVVIVELRSGELFGSAPANLQGIISVADLGIFDVRDVIGIASFAESSRIDRCLSMYRNRCESGAEVEILGIKIPLASFYGETDLGRKIDFGTIDRLSVKQSEARIVKEHDARVASAS